MKQTVNKLRPSPNEEVRILKEERDRRRKLRLLQVREQQRHISNQIVREVEQRRQDEMQRLEQQLRLDWEQQQRDKLNNMQILYQQNLQLLGQSHRSAKENEPDLAAIAQREEQHHDIAEQRHREALKELKAQRLRDDEMQNRLIHARKKALQTEKERSAKVASLPPPPPNPLQNISIQKPPMFRRSGPSAFLATHYHMPENLVEREDGTQQCDAHKEAELEARRLEDLQKEEQKKRVEQLEKARVRGMEALRREQQEQDRDRLLVELEHMQQSDLLRRRQEVSAMPSQIFVPPYMRREARDDHQRELEVAFEDMFTGQRRVRGDVSLQLVPEPLPAPSTSSQDQELDVTSFSSSLVEPSQPARPRALKNLLNRIRNRRNSLTDPISNVQSPHPPLENFPAAEAQLSNELTQRVQELEDEQQRKDEELELEKQYQILLLQDLEEQKAELERLLLEAQQQREELIATVDQSEDQDEELISVSQQLPTDFGHGSDEAEHVRWIREQQQRLLEQNRLHQRSVEVAQQHLDAYQRSLQTRFNLTASSQPSADAPPSVYIDSQQQHRQSSASEGTIEDFSVMRRRLLRSLLIVIEESRGGSLSHLEEPLEGEPLQTHRAERVILPQSDTPGADPSPPPTRLPHPPRYADPPPAALLHHPPRAADPPTPALLLHPPRIANRPPPTRIYRPPRYADPRALLHHPPQPIDLLTLLHPPRAADPPTPALLLHPPRPADRPPAALLLHPPRPAYRPPAALLHHPPRASDPPPAALLLHPPRAGDPPPAALLHHPPRPTDPPPPTLLHHPPRYADPPALLLHPPQPIDLLTLLQPSRPAHPPPAALLHYPPRPADPPTPALLLHPPRPTDPPPPTLLHHPPRYADPPALLPHAPKPADHPPAARLPHSPKVADPPPPAALLHHPPRAADPPPAALLPHPPRAADPPPAALLHHPPRPTDPPPPALLHHPPRFADPPALLLHPPRPAHHPAARLPHPPRADYPPPAALHHHPPRAADPPPPALLHHPPRFADPPALLLHPPRFADPPALLLHPPRQAHHPAARLPHPPPPATLHPHPPQAADPPAAPYPTVPFHPPRTAHPPLTRVRLGLCEMNEQHELSVITEMETPGDSSHLTGPLSLPSTSATTTQVSVMQEEAGQNHPWTHTEGTDGEVSLRHSSEESSFLNWRERILIGASPESSSSATYSSGSEMRRLSLFSSDSAQGAEGSAASTLCSKSPLRPVNPDDQSSSISGGSYVSNDSNTERDSLTSVKHFIDSIGEASPSPTPAAPPSFSSSPAVESLFADSSIQRIIDRYTRELDQSLSSAGRKTDTQGLYVERKGLVSPLAHRPSESSSSVTNKTSAEEPVLEHLPGLSQSQDEDSFHPLIGQPADQSSCLAPENSSLQLLVGQPTAQSSMIGVLYTSEQRGWDSALSRMMGRLSQQSTSVWMSSGRGFSEAPSTSGQEMSKLWWHDSSGESRMMPLVAELDESEELSGSSGGGSTPVVPSQPTSPPEGSRHASTVTGSDPHHNPSVCTELDSHRDEVLDSFHPLQAELTTNQSADVSVTFDLLPHAGPDSPAVEPGRLTPEQLRADKSQRCEETSPQESFYQCCSDSAPLLLDQEQATDSSHLQMDEDQTTVSQSETKVCEVDQPHVMKRVLTDLFPDWETEKGIMDQSQITLLSVTDTTLQDSVATVTEEEEGQHVEESERTSLPEDGGQTCSDVVLGIQWTASDEKLRQAKLRALLHRSTHRVEMIKIKKAEDKRTQTCSVETKPDGKPKKNQSKNEAQAAPSGEKLHVKTCTPETRKRDVSAMHRRTQRLWDQLEEVKQQKAVRSRQDDSTKNRLKAKEFHEKTLQKLRAKQSRQ